MWLLPCSPDWLLGQVPSALATSFNFRVQNENGWDHGAINGTTIFLEFETALLDIATKF